MRTCTGRRVGYGFASLGTLGLYFSLYIGVPALDNAWFVGSGLFLFFVLLLQAAPCLQSTLANVHREPDWLDKIEGDAIAGPLFKGMHVVIVAGVFTSVFYYFCVRLRGWSGGLPHVEEWSVSDFLQSLGSYGGLAWTLHEVTSQVALTMAKKWSHRRRRVLEARHMGAIELVVDPSPLHASTSTPTF